MWCQPRWSSSKLFQQDWPDKSQEPRPWPSGAARPGGLDEVTGWVATVPGRLGRQVDVVDLEVDDEAEDEDRGAEVHPVGQVLT